MKKNKMQEKIVGKENMKETIILSLGGSLIIPDEIDTLFLKSFKTFILDYLNKNKRFVIICGGGKIARKYQDSAKEIANIDNNDLDKIGIQATKINAYLIKSIFSKRAHKKIIDNPAKKIDFKEDLLVASGWKPGFSSDMDAVLLAKNLNVERVINLSNITYAYNKDPKKYPDAKPLKDISWKDFLDIIPKKWEPGLNSPFDPIASKKAKEIAIEVIIANGKDFNNLRKYIDNKEDKEFIGTRIHP